MKIDCEGSEAEGRLYPDFRKHNQACFLDKSRGRVPLYTTKQLYFYAMIVFGTDPEHAAGHIPVSDHFGGYHERSALGTG
jgi:hypothetical protein